MNKSKYILSFLMYAPRVYSALDRFDVTLANKMLKQGYIPVFVFCDTMSDMPTIQVDLEKLGAIVEIITSMASIGRWNFTKNIICLYRKYHPVIVHTHFLNYLKMITLFLSLYFGAKHFTTYHSMITKWDVQGYKSNKGIVKLWGIRVFLRLVSRFSKQVFVVSQLNYKHYCEFCGYMPANLQCLYLGVSTTTPQYGKEQVRLSLELPQDAIILCNISAKESLKCIDVQLKALAILIKHYPNREILYAHIGGLRVDNEENRAYEQSLNALVDELGITDKVVWLGRRNDIADIMPAFDIYIHPSRFEGLPTVLMEAAQASLPMVGTKAGGIPEFVHEGENGYLCAVDDAEDLAQKIVVLLHDESLRKKFGESSHDLLLQEFDINNQTDKLLHYYLD